MTGWNLESRIRVLRGLLLLLSALALSGCATTHFYGQLASGQIRLLLAREPVAELLVQPDLDAGLRERLVYARRALEFARQELLLPASDSYTTYADLQRGHALWTLYAAPEFSVKPLTWCYPIAGCTVYRGYFSREDAAREAQILQEKGFDTYIGGVRAYSTLGWFSDPLLNTFVFDDDIDLAALLFHELAHQLVYVKGDTAFNEGFASFVEAEGLRRWVSVLNRPEALPDYQARQAARNRFVSLVSAAREKLAAAYRDESDLLQRKLAKQQVLAALTANFQDEMKNTPALQRYQSWFQQGLNNAKLATVSTYHDRVPDFAHLLRAADNDLAEFYLRCQEIARLEPAEREKRLSARSD